jgi:serine/threonine protein kinase
MSDFVGRTIGEYQLVQLMGESDQTLLFKAFQPSMDRYVAVTLLKPHVAQDASAVQRFLQTAKIAAQMQHPNILPIYDSGQDEDMVYRVTPFLELGTVRENLIWFHDLNDASVLVGQITAGLESIYAQGYMHGNLKSSNTYLDAQRRPLLSDFGMPHPPGGVQDPYLSPEQVQGGVVDQRSDVYALGVLLYELLTGYTPPAGVVASLRSKRPELPEAVERVVLKAMAQNPDQRFQSPAEFREALQNAAQPLASQPAATPVSSAAPAPGVSQTVQVQQAKSTNWTAIILGVLLIAVLAGAAYLILPGLLQGDEGGVAPTQPPVEQPPVVEPTQPSVVQPTELPVEQPTEQPPEVPDNELPGGGLPDICGSIGMAGGIAALGIALTYSKRRRRL